MAASNTPKHIAIIMDGNGRWAAHNKLPRIEGHRRGAEAAKRVLRAAQENGVKNLTLYAFSVENWNRPKDEVLALMDLLERFLCEQIPELIKRKIRLRVIGRYSELPERIQALLHEAEETTQDYYEYTLGLALNYGSRTEVVDAVRHQQAASEGLVGLKPRLRISPILYTRDMPDPDLVIRTSGECRLSNFLLLQSAYAEIYLSKVLWPDFDEAEFKAAIAEYSSRERRYGKTTEQIKA